MISKKKFFSLHPIILCIDPQYLENHAQIFTKYFTTLLTKVKITVCKQERKLYIIKLVTIVLINGSEMLAFTK